MTKRIAITGFSFRFPGTTATQYWSDLLGGRDLVICRTRDGLFALDNICTHALARLSEGRLRGQRLICPLHGASFDVRDGRVLGAPAQQPLKTYKVRVQGDRIEIAVGPT